MRSRHHGQETLDLCFGDYQKWTLFVTPPTLLNQLLNNTWVQTGQQLWFLLLPGQNSDDFRVFRMPPPFDLVFLLSFTTLMFKTQCTHLRTSPFPIITHICLTKKSGRIGSFNNLVKGNNFLSIGQAMQLWVILIALSHFPWNYYLLGIFISEIPQRLLLLKCMNTYLKNSFCN